MGLSLGEEHSFHFGVKKLGNARRGELNMTKTPSERGNKASLSACVKLTFTLRVLTISPIPVVHRDRMTTWNSAASECVNVSVKTNVFCAGVVRVRVAGRTSPLSWPAGWPTGHRGLLCNCAAPSGRSLFVCEESDLEAGAVLLGQMFCPPEWLSARTLLNDSLIRHTAHITHLVANAVCCLVCWFCDYSNSSPFM